MSEENNSGRDMLSKIIDERLGGLVGENLDNRLESELASFVENHLKNTLGIFGHKKDAPICTTGATNPALYNTASRQTEKALEGIVNEKAEHLMAERPKYLRAALQKVLEDLVDKVIQEKLDRSVAKYWDDYFSEEEKERMGKELEKIIY